MTGRRRRRARRRLAEAQASPAGPARAFKLWAWQHYLDRIELNRR